jgi:hypothetical protein
MQKSESDEAKQIPELVSLADYPRMHLRMQVGMFNGAQSLREPFNRNVFHVRASYFDYSANDHQASTFTDLTIFGRPPSGASTQVFAHYPGQFKHGDLRLAKDRQQLRVGVDVAFVCCVLQAIGLDVVP